MTRVADALRSLNELHREGTRSVFMELIRLTGGDQHRAEDLTQETFSRACQQLTKQPDVDISIGWLVVVARNVCLDGIRRGEREQAAMLVLHTDVVHQRDPLNEVMGRDEAVRVLSKMSDEHRAVLVLRYLYDLPVDDVAQLLDRSRRATESLLVRARQRLAVLIGDPSQGDSSQSEAS